MSERTAAFCDRHPLFVAALYCVVVIGLGAWSPTLAVVAATALAAAAWRINGWRMAAGWMCCATFAVTVMTARERHRVAAGERLVAGAVGEARGQLTEDARQQGRYWSAPVRLKGGPCSGTKVWWEGSGEPPVAGALVTGKGGFEPLPVTRNPGEFDRGSWLRQRGIAAVFFAGRMPGTVEVPTATRLGATIRHGLRDRIIAGLEEPSKSADIIRAVVIGEKPRDGKELVESFRNSGTLHVFTVSGLHVALVATIGWLALSFAGVTRRRAVIVLVPLVFAYAWATGNEAPAVRSAWMTTVFLGAFVWRRRPDLLNSLGAVLLAALLWDGRLLFLPGVQLSYGVVAAIALAAGPASNCFAWMARPELYLPVELMSRWQLRWWRFRRRLAQSLGVSLAAAVGSAPLTAWHFGLFTPVSVLAGVCILPLVFGMLALALASVALSPLVPPGSRLLNQINGKLALVVAGVAETGAAVPGGHFRLRRESTTTLRIFDFDRGAAAACFSSADGASVLIDCGDRPSFEYRLVPSLRSLGIEPDSVVITHPDGAHAGGGAPVWELLPIRQVALPVSRSRSPAIRSWIDSAPDSGVDIRQIADHRSLEFPDGAELEILHAPDPMAVSTAADDRVAILRLHWQGWRFLFTSDAGMGTELALLDRGTDLSADVIIAGKHLRDLSLCEPFVEAVGARVMVLSNPPFPLEQRRKPAEIAYWRSQGIHVFDQADTGAVSFQMDDEGRLRVEEFVTGNTVRFNRR